MGAYVQSNLTSGETVHYEAKPHWFIFILPGLLWLFPVARIAAAGAAPGSGSGILFFWMVAVVMTVRAAIFWWATELVITSKRVIAKEGLIRRKTIELNHKKIESLNVDQGILGRIFGFGTIVIVGTGGSKNPIKNIACPLVFRKAANEIVDSEG